MDHLPKFFEDFRVGACIVTRGRTIDVADITAFAGLTGNHYPLHTDSVFMARSRFGTRICHGSFTYSIAVGLVNLSGFYGDALYALPDVTSMKALRPVLPGDTVKVEASIISAQPRDSHVGILEVAYSVRNQRSEEVMTFVQFIPARRRTYGF
jgi:3-hydroxybutyryl-CoA dehydratase